MEVLKLFVEFYRDIRGHCPFDEWMDTLSEPIQARLTKRLIRLSNGLLGDVEPIGDGLSELREHFGAGYRMYVGIRGSHALVLLGSDKTNQERTIILAKSLWKEWKIRMS